MSFGVDLPGRRWRRLALTMLVLAGLPAAARAQTGECDGTPGERELRSLSFRGNRAFSTRDLALRVATTQPSIFRRSLRFGTRRCLDTDVLRLDVGRLRVFYQRHGYYGATVDTAVTSEPDGSVRVAFVVDEGMPVVIDSLRVEGLDAVTGPLADTSRVEMRKGAVFDRTALQATIDSIKSRLRNNGFPRADVAASYTVDTVRHHALVDFDVLPGRRARIGEVRVFSEPLSGDAARIGAPTVQRLTSVRPGDLYREQDLAEAQRGLYQTDLFQKVEVRIAPDSAQPRGDTLVTIDVLLRESYLRQIDTELGWAVLDCFKERTTYIDRNFLGQARRLELTAQVSKVGYATPTRFANGNLCAPAIRDDSAFSSKLNYFTSASVRLPTLFGYRTSPTLSIYSERRSEYLAYLRTTVVGGEASLTRDVARALPLRLSYSLEYGRTEAPPALLCAVFSRCDAESRAFIERNRRLAVTGAHLDRVRTDNPLNPRDGTVLRFDVRSAFRELGSDSALQFLKLLGDASLYRPLSSGVTLAARVRLGTVLGRTLSFADSAGFIPQEERLYAGGPTSVRGFQQNNLGDLIYIAEAAPVKIAGNGDTAYFELPSDSRAVRRVVPVGGTSLVVANVELRLRSPLFPELLQYTLFADAGDVWQRGTEIGSRAHKASALFLNGLKWTPGAGVRVFTPVGPFQANVGYNPFPQPPGAIYYDAPNTQGFVLYCVTPGNNIPATPNPRNGNALEQDPSRGCPATFTPERPSGLLRHLTFTFSIGPDF